MWNDDNKAQGDFSNSFCSCFVLRHPMETSNLYQNVRATHPLSNVMHPHLSPPSRTAEQARLSSVGGSRHIATTPGPVDVNVLALGVLVARVLGLDAESVGAKVVALGLEQVGGQVLGADAVVEGERGGEGGGGDTPGGGLGDDVAPAGLRGVDGLVEEVVEEQVLEVRVGAVGLGDVLEEDRADDAPSAPHERDFGLLEFPAVFLGSL